MTHRQRFLETMAFGRPDRPFRWESLGFWGATIRRWETEGLPRGVAPERYFEFDPREDVPVNSGFTNCGFCPGFEEKILEENSSTVVRRDGDGIVKRERKDNPELSMPQFLEFPVKTRKDFEELKSRLDPATPERCGEAFRSAVQRYKTRDFPVTLLVCGAFGFPRNLFGVERLLVTYYDDPQLIEDILEHWVFMYKGIFRRVLSEIDVDMLLIWEDMCFKNGPLISPAMFRRFMLEPYREVISEAKRFGVPVIMVDTDGDARLLIPLFVEAGVNALIPFEAAAGMDPVPLREKYGRSFAIVGGIDKRALSGTIEDVEREVLSKVPRLLETGGYIPCLDHSAPPDIPFRNFARFVELARSCATV